MADDEQVPHGEIDWTTASVRDGRLTVEITGDPGSEWSERVREVAERLDRPGSAWGAIALRRSTLRVEGVAEGAEADLRHLVESAVLQANAEFADEDDDDVGSEQDRAMTAAFRAFAGSAAQDDDGEEAG